MRFSFAAYLTVSVIAFLSLDDSSIAAQAKDTTNRTASAASTQSAWSTATTMSPTPKVTVYYFHAAVRCASCNLIEAYTSETLRLSFADALKEGRLEMRVVNRDAPENQHYKKDYNLVANALVAVKEQNGKTLKWSNLEKIWDYLDDPKAFKKYVSDSVAPMLR